MVQILDVSVPQKERRAGGGLQALGRRGSRAGM